MSNRFVSLFSATLVLGLMLIWSPVQARYIPGVTARTSAQAERVPGVLIVNFKPGVVPSTSSSGRRMDARIGSVMGIAGVDALNAQWNLRQYRPLFTATKAPVAPLNQPDLRGYHVLEFDPDIDLDVAAAEYLADPNVESVEFDFYAYIMRTPNDTYFSQMWQLDQTSDRDIDAPEAWDRTTGNPTVILADTDTGVLYHHEDLEANIWVNPGEDLDGDGVVFDVGDLNGVDDDGNGYVDDLVGYDFVHSGTAVWSGEDGSVQDNDPSDFNGHGTHTSGTMAAVSNNGKGVASLSGGFGPGVEPGCKIMCLRMGYSFNDNGQENGRTHMNYVAQAFEYAANNGATAINYSFGSSSGGGIEAATDYAVAAGVIIAASAGNDGGGVYGYLQNRADVLCVASTTYLDKKSGFSNYGPEVDISAPGSSILSTVSNHYSPGYATYGGTSMAAPHVASLAGLIRSLNPALTRTEIIDRILNNADNIDAVNPSYVGMLGAGRINAEACLLSIASANFSASPRIGNAPLTVQFADSSITPATGWIWDFGDGDTAYVASPVHTYSPGLYDVTLQINSAIGDGVKTKFNYVAALAETLTATGVEVLAGDPAVVELYAVNNLPVDSIVLPVTASNIMAKGFLDSVVTTGCRTEGMTSQIVFDSRYTGQLALQIYAAAGQDRLSPGAGPVAKVYFRTKSTANPGDSIAVTLGPMGSWDLLFKVGAIGFQPVLHTGAVTIGAIIGDFDDSGVVDAVDLGALIDVIFFSAPMPSPPAIADINCDGPVDALDLAVMIDFVFFSGPAPCE